MLSRRGIRFWSTCSFARIGCFWAIFYQFLSPLQFSLLWRNRSGPVQLPFAAIFFSKYVDIYLAILFDVAFNVSLSYINILLSYYLTSAQYVFCKVYFSAQPNKLRHILNFDKYYPIEHIFVPACSSARKIHFFKF